MNSPPAPGKNSRVLTLFLQPLIALLFLTTAIYLHITNWTERFIPRLETQKASLVIVKESTGASSYRDHHDLIWLKLRDGNPFTAGDTLETSSRGSITLSFTKNPENQIKIQPSSLVRILQVDGKILIQVKKGAVESSFKTQVDDVQIQTPDGQISKVQPVSLAGTDQNSEKSLEESIPLQEDSKDEPAKSNLGHHYPSQKALLIYKEAQSLNLTVNQECLTPCELTIKMNGQILLQKKFSEKTRPQLEFRWPHKTSGKIQWTLRSDQKADEIDAEFDLIPYSDQAFEQSLKTGQPIEILE